MLPTGQKTSRKNGQPTYVVPRPNRVTPDRSAQPTKRRSGIASLVSWLVVDWGLVVATAGVAIALVAGRSAQTDRANETMIVERANERATGYAVLLGDTFAANLRQVDTLHVMAQRATDAWLTGNQAEFDRLRAYLTPTDRMWGPDMVQIAALDAAGKVIWSSLGTPGVGRDLHDRDYFQALSLDPARDFAIGAPALGRLNGIESVLLARAMRDEAGRLRAVTVLSIRASMLARLCAALNLDPDDTVSLVRSDGVVLMQRGSPPTGPPPEPAGIQARYPIAGHDMAVLIRLSPARVDQTLAAMRATLRVWSWGFNITILIFAGTVAVGLVLYRRYDRMTTRAKTLAQSDAWFRSVIDDMADGMLIYEVDEDIGFKITYANRKAAEIAGVSAEALIGSNGHDLLQPDDRQRRVELMAANDLPDAPYPLPRPDGSIVRIALTSVRSNSPLGANASAGGSRGTRCDSDLRPRCRVDRGTGAY